MSSNNAVSQMSKWADELLKAGKLPESPANIETLVAQQEQEGSQYPTNPLNIRNQSGGGIGPYNDTQAGITATLSTLRSMDPAYYQALQQNTGTDPAPNLTALAQSTWEGLPPGSSANKAYAGNVTNTLVSLYGKGAVPAEYQTTSHLNVITPSGNSADWFTNAMITLDAVMHSGGVVPFEEVMARFMAGAAFAGVGVVALISIFTGGKITGSDIPGLVAGFMGGPETGAATLLSKLGVRKARSNTPNEIEPARLALAQQRLQLTAAKEERVAKENEERRIAAASRTATAEQHRQESLALSARRQDIAEAREKRVKSESLAKRRANKVAVEQTKTKLDLSAYRAQTQRKAVLLKARQQRAIEKALEGD